MQSIYELNACIFSVMIVILYFSDQTRRGNNEIDEIL
jgi:hypothetical protein